VQFLKLVAAAIVIAGLAYWLTFPTDTVAVDPSCKVVNLDDQLSEALHPSAFWQAQRVALREAREVEERLQATSGFGADSKPDKIETPIERKMDRLSDRAAQEAESQAEQEARIRRIAWMTKCDGIIASRVGSP